MKIEDIMTHDVKFCGPDTNLAEAAEILWRNNCGALPVLDSGGKVVGMVTDRDMSIAMGTRNWRASDLAVSDLAIKPVFTCRPDDDVHESLKIMCKYQVRRVPVVDESGELSGIVSLNDIVLHAEKAQNGKHGGISYDDIVNTLKAVGEHRRADAVAVGAAG